MKYKGFDMSINPKSFVIKAKKSMSEVSVPNASSHTSEITTKGLVIIGSGSFIGDMAMEKAHELLRVFNKKGSDYLFLPSGDVVLAFFSNLTLNYDGSTQRVDYSFEFTEDNGKRTCEHIFGYTYAKEGENLFDVANRTDKRIERLVALNDYESVFAVAEGDKIWLM